MNSWKKSPSRAKKLKRHRHDLYLKKSLSCKLGEYPGRRYHQRLVPLLALLSPSTCRPKHYQREDTGAHEPSAWPNSEPLMSPMTINNNSQAICCSRRKGWRPPRIQILQPSHLQLKGGETLLLDRRIPDQALSFTASCKTPAPQPPKCAASISGRAVGTRLTEVKLPPFPAFLWTYARGQRSPEKLTMQLSSWEGK